MKTFIILPIFLTMSLMVNAQCNFDPTITGEVILCPNSTSSLSTQEYDSYQWYKREYSEPTSSPIIGDTLQSILINNPSDVLYYFSVEATKDSCSEFSPEVLVDGWVFIPVTVASTGDFTIGNNGESIVCIGDTMYFTLNLPYNTNITWFKNGNPIPGETSTILPVTSPGLYTVSGAPENCPNYLQSLGLNLEVLFIECTTSINEELIIVNEVLVYPNPAANQISVMSQNEKIFNIKFYDNLGQSIYSEDISSKHKSINISGFEKGVYLLEINRKSNIEFHKILIQ